MNAATSPVLPGRDERRASRRLRPLAGQTAVVTGGGRGLGAAIAARLAEDGANLVLAARTLKELDHVAGQARAHGIEVTICGCDVTDAGQVRQLFSTLPEGRVEVLVNCAGTNRPEPFLQVDPATFDLIMAVNLRGAFLASQAAADHMIRQGTGGSIVNVTSQMGHVGAANRSVYCASKHALEGLTKGGADQILCLGGVQAFAALAFGIEDIGPVDFIAGAGNAHVAEAKRQLFGRVGIDLLAGPTEVAVICDDSADPRLAAADLLGQAEHGPTSPATCITTSHTLGAAVLAAVDGWLAGAWPTKEVVGAAWRDYGSVIVCADNEEAARVSDQLAPEHLEVQTADPDWYLGRLRNYGSLFLGRDSTVAYSDKAIGTNHVLPTGTAARYTGGLWVGKFLKTVTYQKVTPEGSRHVARPTAGISDAEHMSGHALTARLRLDPSLLAGSKHAEQVCGALTEG